MAVALNASRPGSNGSETTTSASAYAASSSIVRNSSSVKSSKPYTNTGVPAPRRRVGPERRQRAPGEQVVVHQAGRVQAVAVAPVQLADLLGVRRPRPVAGPVPQRPDQPRRLDHRSLQLGEEAQRRAGEARPPGRLGQHREARPAHRVLGHELLLELGRHPRVVARPARDQPRQVREADHLGAEGGAGLGQLAAAVLDVLERRHHQHRLLVQAVAQRAQHGARLGGVRGTGDERQTHGTQQGVRHLVACRATSPARTAAGDRLGIALGRQHRRRLLELPALGRAQHPAAHAHAAVVEAPRRAAPP